MLNNHTQLNTIYKTLKHIKNITKTLNMVGLSWEKIRGSEFRGHMIILYFCTFPSIS